MKLGALLHGLFAKLPDRELTIETAASLAVPDLADACELHVLEPDGTVRRRASATHLPEKSVALRTLEQYRPDTASLLPSRIALGAGHSVFVPSVDDARLASWSSDPDHLAALRALAPRSTLALPLVVRRGEVIGAMTLHRFEGCVPFTSADLVVAEEIARFAALALDNARLIEALEASRAEAAAARDRLRDMLMRAPYAISLRRGPDLEVDLQNERYVELLGEGGSIVPRQVLDRIYAEGVSVAERELRLALPDGRDVYVDYTVQPTRDAGGRIDGLVKFIVEVTANVRARKDIELLARRVEDQQRWLQSVLGVIPVPVALVEQESGRVLFANGAADRIAGGRFARGEGAEGAPLRFKDSSGHDLPPDALPIARAARGERLDGVQMDLVTPLGRTSLLVHSEMLPPAFGHAATAVVAFDDVSQMKQVEAQLQAAVRVRDEFLSIASHELKTPLTALRLQVQGLLRAAQPDSPPRLQLEKLQGRLQAIDRNVDRLDALIDKLLSVPRISRGVSKLERETFDLAGLVDSVVSRFADELTRAGSALEVHLTRPVFGSWDRTRVDQILTNILANAVKYGRGRPIELALGEEPGRAILTVRDHGIGVAPADQERIFERFERAVSGRNYGGFGLGLFIARHFAEAHGGKIRVESALGQGATFSVELPKG